MLADKFSLEETEKCLHMWIKLATNPECVSPLLDGLACCRDGMTTCLQVLLEKAQQTEACLLEKAISTLLHTLAQVRAAASADRT